MRSSKLLLITILLGLCFIAFTKNPEPEFLDVDEDMSVLSEEKRNLASVTYNNIRMTPMYAMNATASYQSYFKNKLIPPIISFFQAALKVKYPVTTTIKLPSTYKTICKIPTPQALLDGVATDYIIFFNNWDPSGANSTASVTVASSYACYLAKGSNRPIIANTKVNPGVLVDAGDNVLLHEKNMYLIMHEMTHTLGFGKSLYRYFLDENGVLRTGHMKNLTLDGATSLVLDVPPLTQRLRTFFGCPTLEGAFMENSGSSATAGDHFERRMFVFEAMTSGLIYGQSYSQFTLALLEGSGWYVPNYSMADPYWFGQGQGCTFLKGSCTSSSFNFEEFCKDSSRGCNTQGRGGGFCQTDLRSNNCKYYAPNLKYDCEYDGYAASARLPTAETFGRASGAKCFSGNLSTKKSSFSTSFCFKPTCTGTGTSTVLSIKVGTTSVICKAEGPTPVTGYYGTINCPDPVSYCNTVGKPACPRGCMGRGSCVSGKCVCKTGFKGKDCALNV